MRVRSPACALLLLCSTLAQEPTARLEGLVLDSHQQPVPAARVEARRNSEVLATTFSDATGLFAFGKLPTTVVLLRVTTTAPDVGGAYVDLRADSRSFVQVAMMPARKVSGKVADPGGAPVAGAFVAMVPPGPEEFGAMAQSMISDEEGQFTFAHAPFGDVAIRVWMPGRRGCAVDITGTADESVTCVLGSGEPQHRSFVLADATDEFPARAELRVRALAGKATVPLPDAVAQPPRDDDGTWHVYGWPSADEMRARVELEGALIEPFEHDIPPGVGDRRKTFYVEESINTWIRGRLLATDDSSVAGRRLLACVGSYAVDRVTTTTTNADGSFKMLSPTPTQTPFTLTCLDTEIELLSPSALDWLEFTKFRLLHKPDRVHELAIRRALPVNVTVQGRGDAPCPGATVLVLGRPPNETTSRVGRIRVHVWHVLARGLTDAKGRASLTGARLKTAPDVVVHVIGPSGYATKTCVLDRDGRDLGTIELGFGATIRGTVQRADGTPWPGAHVTVTNFIGSRHTFRLTADRDGAFTVRGLGAGPTTVGLVGSRRSQTLSLQRGESVEAVVR